MTDAMKLPTPLEAADHVDEADGDTSDRGLNAALFPQAQAGETTTLYLERSGVRSTIIQQLPLTGEPVLKAIDTLTIFTGADFAAVAQGAREALIAAKCTSHDGTVVHASMADVLRALAVSSTSRGTEA